MTRDKYGIYRYANSTLLAMPKSELLAYIRTIEKNWRNAKETIEIQANNCKRLLNEERNNAIEDYNKWITEQIAAIDCKTGKIIVVRNDKWVNAKDVFLLEQLNDNNV